MAMNGNNCIPTEELEFFADYIERAPEKVKFDFEMQIYDLIKSIRASDELSRLSNSFSLELRCLGNRELSKSALDELCKEYASNLGLRWEKEE